jgi:hypothetical protein
MAEQQQGVSDAAQQAHEQGYIGDVHDEIENDAYTVQGQGPETAKREREQRRSLRTKFEDASVEGDDASSGSEQQPAQHAQPTSTSSTSKRTSSSSSTSESA